MRLQGPGRFLFNILAKAIDGSREQINARAIPGLKADVEVVTDDWGVPHIYAQNRQDLFFAQGYVTARDRFLQLDFGRHGASGRICELVGRRTVPWQDLTIQLKERTTYDVDVMVRTFGMRDCAQRALGEHSQESQDILSSYAQGVNAFLAEGKRTLEHKILGVEPRPWEPIDSLTLVKAMGFELNFAWRSILMGSWIIGAGVAPELAAMLWPHFPQDGESIIGAEGMAQLAEDLLATRKAAEVAVGTGNAPGVGSNCSAVAGTHTTSGDALLANDTHLTLTTPVPWHEVHLSCPDMELQGFALAGAPGIGIGRNPHHAWGITAGLIQDLDIFVEKHNPENADEYLTPDGWKEFQTRDEVFTIKGEGSHTRPIRVSRHGPILETIYAQAPQEHSLAIAWTGHLPGCEIDTLLAMWEGKNREEAMKAMDHHVCPNFNISYAGADGRIGYFLTGVIPKRKKNTPLRPLEGWTGEWDWDGIVPTEQNPRLLDPECGFSVTANNRPAPFDYPYELGNTFEPPDRFNRLSELLTEQGKKVSFADMANNMLDLHGSWALEVRELFLDILGGASGLNLGEQSLERAAADLWLDWDGQANRSSAGAAIAYGVAMLSGREVMERLAGQETGRAFMELASFMSQPILRLKDAQPLLAEHGVDVVDVIRTAFQKTVDLCVEEMGTDSSAWEWGKLHTLRGRHPLSGSPLGWLFSIGPEPVDGGPDTVNRGDVDASGRFRYKVGPAMRMVINAASGEYHSVIPGGQSGNRFSKHYDDQLGEFLAGRLKEVRVSRSEIATARVEKWSASAK